MALLLAPHPFRRREAKADRYTTGMPIPARVVLRASAWSATAAGAEGRTSVAAAVVAEVREVPTATVEMGEMRGRRNHFQEEAAAQVMPATAEQEEAAARSICI